MCRSDGDITHFLFFFFFFLKIHDYLVLDMLTSSRSPKRLVFHFYLVSFLCQLVGESSAPIGSDPIAMMEYYMKKAAQEEKLRPHKSSKDEMPPPASLQG